MKQHEINALVSYAATAGHKKKVAAARATILKAFEMLPEERWYVAFSGGKDSTVVFNLVRGVYPAIPGIWCDDEFYLPETAEYMACMKDAGVRIKQVPKRVKHTEWFTANEDKDNADIYDGYEGVFLGLRAQENTYRRQYLRKYGTLYYAKRGAVSQGWLCNPIAWWKIEDVWAYIFSRRVDYNRAYDRLAELGIPLAKQRIGPYAVDAALGYGQLAILKKGWPEEYRRFLARHPEASRYT